MNARKRFRKRDNILCASDAEGNGVVHLRLARPAGDQKKVYSDIAISQSVISYNATCNPDAGNQIYSDTKKNTSKEIRGDE
jgi:hypothetical protein